MKIIKYFGLSDEQINFYKHQNNIDGVNIEIETENDYHVWELDEDELNELINFLTEQKTNKTK